MKTERELVMDLSLLVARMARRLRRNGPTVHDAGDRALADQAVAYLRRHQLTSPLRDGAGVRVDAPAQPIQRLIDAARAVLEHRYQMGAPTLPIHNELEAAINAHGVALDRAPLTDEQAMRVVINACDSLNITRVHELGGKTQTICDEAGLLEIVRAVEAAHDIAGVSETFDWRAVPQAPQTGATAGVRVDAPYHCAPEDIDALLRWLDAINDPQQDALPSLENTDWRGRAGIIARVIRHLCGTRGVAAVAPSDEAEFCIEGGGGMFLASSQGRRAEAWREIQHYAAQYADEGPLTIYEVTRKPVTAAGVAPSQAPSEREQALAGLVKRLARRLHPEDNLRVTATEYLKEQGFFNPLRTSGVPETFDWRAVPQAPETGATAGVAMPPGGQR